jgi:hypothetical protein
VGSLLLLVVSFMPWYAPEGIGTSNGWHQMGPLEFILALALLAWEASRIARAEHLTRARADQATAGIAVAIVVLALVFFLVRLSDGALGAGVWLGLVATVLLAIAAWLLIRGAGGIEAVRETVDEMGDHSPDFPPE